MTHLGPSLRRAKIRERPARRVALALLVSLVLNGLGLIYLQRSGAFDVASTRVPARVALAPMSAAQWAANRAVKGERPAPAAKPAKPSEPFAMPRSPEKAQREPPTMPGQVVDVAPSKDSTPPKNTRFLADRDNTVEKETLSKYRKPGYERTLAVPSAPGVVSAPPPGQDGSSDRAVPGLEGRPAQPDGRAGGPKVAMAPEPKGELAPANPTGEGGAPAPVPSPGEGEGGLRLRGSPADGKSLITPGTLARVAGGPAPDHVEGIEEGEGTFLNTRGWKYATYFNRIKQAVAAVWDPSRPLEARDPDRTMYGYKDRFTLLGVTLDDAGHVKNLVVEQTCGVDFLDRAAMSAFREAQPFVNPPRGIVDQNGEIKFSFGFFLEVGHGGLRIYRAPIPASP